MMRNFIWKDAATSPINFDTLTKSIQEGDIKLLDLKARNEAIELTWLRSYLDLSKIRPIWAYIADVLIAWSVASLDRNTISKIRNNVYLQTWQASIHKNAPLADDLKRMLKVAKKYNANFHAIKLTLSIKCQLLAWYHIRATDQSRRLLNNTESQCLVNNHNACTVADIMRIVKCTMDSNVQHREHRNCACRYCRDDRDRGGCANPNKCTKTAERILRTIKLKWATDNNPPEDQLTLTTGRHEKNLVERQKPDGVIMFDPSVTTVSPLAEGFHVFTNPEIFESKPAHRRARWFEVQDKEVTFVFD